MRIAMISEHASPLATLGGVDAGGQNAHVAELAGALAGQGHEVRVYTRRDAPGPPVVVGMNGFDVVHVPAGPATAVATLRGVDLGQGTTLLLEPGRELDAADLQAILDAARPLLAVLRERGLDRAAGGPGRGTGPRPEDPPELRREHP